MIDKAISAKFANMGFVSVCLVVSMHVHCEWEGGGINQLAVPFFFAMSGYFLAMHVDENGWYKRALGKRIGTIVVPTFLWCLIWAMYTIPITIFLNLRAGREWCSGLLVGVDVFRYLALDITKKPALGPLWYLRCLFLFVVVSPILIFMIRKLGLLILLLLGYAYYAYSRGDTIDFLSYGFSLEGIFYFSIGLYVCMKQVSLNLGPKIGAPIFVVGVVVYSIGWLELSIAIMLLGCWGLMPTRRMPKVLLHNTFPVYLIHMFLLVLLGNERVSPILAIVIGFIVVALSIAIAEIMRKLFPRQSIVLWGGR